MLNLELEVKFIEIKIDPSFLVRTKGGLNLIIIGLLFTINLFSIITTSTGSLKPYDVRYIKMNGINIFILLLQSVTIF